jgi:hypothetical protein
LSFIYKTTPNPNASAATRPPCTCTPAVIAAAAAPADVDCANELIEVDEEDVDESLDVSLAEALASEEVAVAD